MKVVQEMLRHSSITVTSDTYTTVLPEVARAAADKTAMIIPRARRESLGLPSGQHGTTVDNQDDQGEGEDMQVGGTLIWSLVVGRQGFEPRTY